MLAGLVLSESSLLTIQIVTTLLPLHKVVPSAYTLIVSLCVLTVSSHRDTSQPGLEPSLMASLQLNYPFKFSPSKNSHILGTGNLGLQHRNVEGYSSAHNVDSSQEYKISQTPQPVQINNGYWVWLPWTFCPHKSLIRHNLPNTVCICVSVCNSDVFSK